VKFTLQRFRNFYLNTDGESTAVGPQATSPSKEEIQDKPQEKQDKLEKENKPEEEEPPRELSPVKREKQTDSESEQLQLPPIRPQTVTSSGTKCPYDSSVRVATPKGKPGTAVLLQKNNHALH